LGKTDKEKAKKAALKKELQETKEELKLSKQRIAELEQEKVTDFLMKTIHKENRKMKDINMKSY